MLAFVSTCNGVDKVKCNLKLNIMHLVTVNPNLNEHNNCTYLILYIQSAIIV